MSECQWPTCKDNSLPGKKYCFMHGRVYEGVSTAKPVVAPPKKVAIKKQSSKGKAADAAYKKMIKIKLANNPDCKLKIPGVCTGKAQGGHHKKRRGNNLMDETKLMLSCNACNTWVEAHHKEAKDMGLLESKFN